MCRLTAYVGPEASAETLVFGGTHPLREQAWAPRELLSGSVNADGYGVVWYAGTGPVRVARPVPVWHDPDLRPLLAATRSGTMVAALRNATEGLPVDASGVPPLLHGHRAFVLNGFVPGFRDRHMRALRQRLPDHLYGALCGSSDAETLFLLVVGALEAGAGPGEALTQVARAVFERTGGEETQLTMLLATPGRLDALRTSNTDRVNSLYRLRGGLAGGGTLVASEALDADGGWEEVPAHEPWSAVGGGGDGG